MASYFFDRHLTTSLAPEVLEEMIAVWRSPSFLPSGLHKGSMEARKAIFEARSKVAQWIGAALPEEIIFTGTGTEALNIAFQGAIKGGKKAERRHIILSAIETSALSRTASDLEAEGIRISKVEVNSEGRINIQQAMDAMLPETCLLATHAAHEELGTLQPILEIGKGCRSRDVLFLCDATHAAGWLPIHVQRDQIDLLALSPHRFHGPSGVGILYVRSGTPLHSIIHGGKQEFGIRPGTEAVPLIVGAGAAAQLAQRQEQERINHVTKLQQQLANGLEQMNCGCRIIGAKPGADRISNQLAFHLPGVDAESLILRADLEGYRMAGVSACQSHPDSEALAYIGLSRQEIRESLSIGFDTTSNTGQVDDLLAQIPRWLDRLRE